MTQESVYERPAEYASPRPDAAAADAMPQVADSTLVESGQNNWVKYSDEYQQEFYYNSLTEESQYERPLNFVTPRDSEALTDYAY